MKSSFAGFAMVGFAMAGFAMVGVIGAASAETAQTAAGPMQIDLVVSGLEQPWAVEFLPSGAFVVTERGGVLNRFASVTARPVSVSGLPDLWVEGEGGLLDVMVPRDFVVTRELWLTYAAPVGEGGATAVGKGVLSEDGTSLEGFSQVFVMTSGSAEDIHFGSRLVEAPDGTIFVTMGDRALQASAQVASRAEGKVLHLNRDGSPATRLPYSLAGVYAIGQRNAQGITFDLAGRLLTVEHGPDGGDELNAPVEGGNYGWPFVSHGVNSDGSMVGFGPESPLFEPPLHYWAPSIAPSGLMVYSGKLVADWTGDIFFGSLNSDFLGRLDPDTPSEAGYAEERIAAPETGRVRDVVEAPDGSIWFLSVHEGAVYRLAPGQ